MHFLDSYLSSQNQKQLALAPKKEKFDSPNMADGLVLLLKSRIVYNLKTLENEP
jgi:hypothetical protein